jgi:hypothetical protein
VIYFLLAMLPYVAGVRRKRAPKQLTATESCDVMAWQGSNLEKSVRPRRPHCSLTALEPSGRSALAAPPLRLAQSRQL